MNTWERFDSSQRRRLVAAVLLLLVTVAVTVASILNYLDYRSGMVIVFGLSAVVWMITGWRWMAAGSALVAVSNVLPRAWDIAFATAGLACVVVEVLLMGRELVRKLK
jgi:hypothetical protein